MNRFNRLIGALATAGALLGVSYASAQEYPSKPVTLVHGLSVGGQTDLTVRVLAHSLSRILNAPFVVQPKPGAAQQIAAAFLANAPADGYTIGHFYQGAFSTTPLLQPSAVNVDDLTPIIGWQISPQLLVVRGDSPYKNLADLVAAAKATPDIPYGHLGKGTVTFMAPTVFSKVAGIRLNDIQYKGDADLITAVMGGHIQMASITEVAAAPLLEAGKLRALVTFAKQRTSAFPDIPTFEEQGFNVPIQVPVGIIFVPKGTPPAITRKLGDAIRQVMKDEKAKAEFARMKLALYDLDSKAVSELIENERKTYQPILKETGLIK
ncbi:MAG: Bug family tripartite tricarboxylate transporter substrate binding protein [Burkholderiaceae bacterium]